MSCVSLEEVENQWSRSINAKAFAPVTPTTLSSIKSDSNMKLKRRNDWQRNEQLLRRVFSRQSSFYWGKLPSLLALLNLYSCLCGCIVSVQKWFLVCNWALEVSHLCDVCNSEFFHSVGTDGEPFQLEVFPYCFPDTYQPFVRDFPRSENQWHLVVRFI